MTKVFFIFLFISVFTLPLFAQVDTGWVRRYNGPGNSIDKASDLAIDCSGNIYVIGSSDGDYIIVKYFPNGDTGWVRRYNGPGNGDDRANVIAVDSSCNVYVTGTSLGSGTSYDYLTIKYYSNGDTGWVRRYNGPGNGSDTAKDIVIDASGNACVTGISDGSGTSSDYATIKYNSNGDTAWVKRYDGITSGDCANAIAVDDSGNVYVTGGSDHHTGSEGSVDFITIKYYPNGDTAWVRKYDGEANDQDEAKDIAVDNSDNIYVTGYSNKSKDPDYNYDYLTIKYYPNGDTAWVRRYNGPGNFNDVPNAIAIDGPGNICVTGESYGSGTAMDYTTIKYYPNGDTAWVRRYNCDNDYDGATDLAIDDSGNVYVTGTSAGSGPYVYATIKYDLYGRELWIRRHDGPADSSNYAHAIAVDDSNNIYVTGYGYSSGTNYDYATIKYVYSSIKCGDANGDSKVSVSDVVYLINYLFKGGPAPVPTWKANVNCDNQVTVSDVIYLINYLFKGGPLPGC